MSDVMTTVLLRDPAIDWDATRDTGYDEGAYAEERDVSRLVVKSGEELTHYRFRRLKRSQLNYVARGLTDVEQRERAFAAGVVEVRGPLAPARDGWRPRGVDKPRFTAMSEADLDEFEWVDIQDIGVVVLTVSQLPFGSALRCPMLQSSVSAWVAARPRPAAQSPKPARAESSTPPEGR